MKATEYDLTTEAGRAAFAALGGPRAAKQARDARPDLPRAGRQPATGLSGLNARGWSNEYDATRGYRLWKINGVDAGWHATEQAACAAAKELEKQCTSMSDCTSPATPPGLTDA